MADKMTSTIVFNDASLWRSFEENKITHSAAHYLAAVDRLLADHGYARVTDVAGFLKITRGAASLALSQLKERGLVKEDPNRFLLLTEEGKFIAGQINKNFLLLFRFFNTVLGVSSGEAKENACKMEHLLSDFTSDCMQEFLRVLFSNTELLSILTEKMKFEERSCSFNNSCGSCPRFDDCFKTKLRKFAFNGIMQRAKDISYT